MWLSWRTCLFRCFYQSSRCEIYKCWMWKRIQSRRQFRGAIVWLGKKSIYWFIRRWKTIWTYTHSKARATPIYQHFICSMSHTVKSIFSISRFLTKRNPKIVSEGDTSCCWLWTYIIACWKTNWCKILNNGLFITIYFRRQKSFMKYHLMIPLF